MWLFVVMALVVGSVGMNAVIRTVAAAGKTCHVGGANGSDTGPSTEERHGGDRGDSTGHGVDADHFWRLLLASSDKNVGSIGLRDGGSRQGSCHEPSKRLSNKVVFLHDQDREVFR